MSLRFQCLPIFWYAIVVFDDSFSVWMALTCSLFYWFVCFHRIVRVSVYMHFVVTFYFNKMQLQIRNSLHPTVKSLCLWWKCNDSFCILHMPPIFIFIFIVSLFRFLSLFYSYYYYYFEIMVVFFFSNLIVCVCFFFLHYEYTMEFNFVRSNVRFAMHSKHEWAYQNCLTNDFCIKNFSISFRFSTELRLYAKVLSIQYKMKINTYCRHIRFSSHLRF